MRRNNWTDDKIMSRLLNNKTDKFRAEYISILRGRPGEGLFATCEALTKSSDPKSRIIGIDILAQLGLPPRPFLMPTLKLFFELLKIETEPKVLKSLLVAIGNNNENLTQSQIENLCSFYSNSNNLVKEGLVFSLLRIDNLKAIETLIKLSSDRSSHIRNWATFGIGSQVERDNLNIRDALWARIKDTHHETKLEAMVGLATRKDERINEIIKQEIIGYDYGTLLFKAILETKSGEFLPLLQQNLQLAAHDSTINPEWKKELKDCIDELTELIKNSAK